eukprot:1147929-Pelagomonas_calceolata.AAC.2
MPAKSIMSSIVHTELLATRPKDRKPGAATSAPNSVSACRAAQCSVTCLESSTQSCWPRGHIIATFEWGQRTESWELRRLRQTA